MGFTKHIDEQRLIEDHSGECVDHDGQQYRWFQFFPHFTTPEWVAGGIAQSAEHGQIIIPSRAFNRGCLILRRVQDGEPFGPLIVLGVTEEFSARFTKV